MKNETVEEWRDVPGFEGYYQISNLGRVKSIPRKIKNNGGFYTSKEFNLKLSSRDGRYLNVNLYKNHSYKIFRVHTLVAMAFLNHKFNTKPKMVVDHINNNSKDNRACNLQIISQRVNAFKDSTQKRYSQFIGVSFSQSLQKWRARITVGGKERHLGYFSIEKDASDHYQKAIAKINFFINPKQFRQLICE